MTAQTANEVTVPVGSDGWNFTGHIKQAFESAGLVIPVASQSERDGLAARFPSGVLPNPTYVCRTDSIDKRIETWDGTQWVTRKGIPYTPIWTGATSWGGGGSMVGTYWVDGDMVTVRAKVTSGSTASLGTGLIEFPLPAGLPIAAGTVLGTGIMGGTLRPLVCLASGTTKCSVWAPTVPVNTPGGAGYPFSSGGGDFIEALITYQTTIA